jgi:uncharacterized membrane protein YwaF
VKLSALNRAQCTALVVGFGVALYVLGQWLTSLGSTLNYGWVAYAPLSKSLNPGGLHPWVRYVIWLVLIAIWTLASMALLRSRIASRGDQ